MTTYILVHGAWHSGQCWQRVTPLLEAAGHRVLAPSLSGYGDKASLLAPDVGLDTHVADVTSLLRGEDLRDVVLVGHSYAGMVISGAAHQMPERIRHLVYLDAMVPEHGESAVDVQPLTRQLIEQAARDGHGWRIPPMQRSPHGLFGVTDPEDIEWLTSLLSDHPVRCLTQPAQLDNLSVKAIPCTHIHCVGNQPPGIVRRPVPASQPGDAPAYVRELTTGHDCMITMPKELSALLLECSRH
ncbi:alpha/beta fold hydrolase [Streptomyces sp. NPDC001422]|uniref:alpha/beta hydrolase n=1 Tax=Streptomyces sp. NPDC001422 TaxID=3364575 RepID=UPI003683F673